MKVGGEVKGLGLECEAIGEVIGHWLSQSEARISKALLTAYCRTHVLVSLQRT